MSYKNRYKSILAHDLCIGCGLCEAIGKEDGYTMDLTENGFYRPVHHGERNLEIEETITRICPAININAPEAKDDRVWGNISGLYTVYATDPEVRKTGASGGGITALCIYMVENKIVNGILHVGKICGTAIENKLYVSKSREEVMSNASSRYAPAKVFNEIKNILEGTDETFAFVGKPCDISAIKNYISSNPKYKRRIKYFISFFCAGMPSYLGTQKLLQQDGQTELPFFLKYRGDGWPGYFTANYENGSCIKISYVESWGDVLGKYVHPRCKICPDGIGLIADIVFGDAWETIDGYPDFDEKEGKSLAIARSQEGNKLIQHAILNNQIIANPLEKRSIAKMQPYQYQRRLFVGYRILVIQFLTSFLLNFKNTGYLHLMKKYPIHRGVKNSIGTLKRFVLYRTKNKMV